MLRCTMIKQWFALMKLAAVLDQAQPNLQDRTKVLRLSSTLHTGYSWYLCRCLAARSGLLESQLACCQKRPFWHSKPIPYSRNQCQCQQQRQLPGKWSLDDWAVLLGSAAQTRLVEKHRTAVSSDQACHAKLPIQTSGCFLFFTSGGNLMSRCEHTSLANCNHA